MKNLLDDCYYYDWNQSVVYHYDLCEFINMHELHLNVVVNNKTIQTFLRDFVR